MFRWLFVMLMALSACAGPAATISKSANGQIFEAVFEDLPDHGVTKFDIRVSADAPAWRIWNFVFTDPQRLAAVSNGEASVTEFKFVGPQEVHLKAEIDVAWWLPDAQIEARWYVKPQDFMWEQQCIEGWTRDCYIRGSFSPLDDGARTLVRYQGYIRRPWFISHGSVVANLVETFRAAQTGVVLIAHQPAYANRNQKFPWDDLNAFSTTGTAGAAQPVSAAPRPKLLVQDFVVTAGNVTDTTVVRLASTYLAERLSASPKFEVMTDWDVRVMSKYLNADWQLNCNQEAKCTERLLSITKAKYVLAGEVARTDTGYAVSFVVMNADTLSPAWRFHREVPSSSADLKAAVADAATQVAQQL